MTVEIITCDCREALKTIPDNSVDCVVTSPPYWGLRDYGTASWSGGDPACDHIVGELRRGIGLASSPASTRGGGHKAANVNGIAARAECPHCGAVRVDRQIGLEPRFEDFLAQLVGIFAEVRRVLKPSGTCWVNMGDSYAGSGKGGNPEGGGKQATNKGSQSVGVLYGREGVERDAERERMQSMERALRSSAVKPKDLIGQPWRLAFALQADGWYLRQDIIWCLSGGTWLYARTPNKSGPMMLKDLVRLAPDRVELWNGERWTKVTAWTKRHGRADAVELVLRSGERIGCTSNHVWPTSRGNIRTDELCVGDIIKATLLPDCDRPQGWIIDDAFWFAGLYLAEGSRSGETIQISGHVREAEERLRRCRALVSHYGGSARAYRDGNAHNIHIDSIGLSAILRSLIAGKTAKDKRLAPAAWRYPNWQLRQIAEGYLHGDGHIDGGRIRLGFCRNYFLERDLRCLAARLGATLTLKPGVAKNQRGSFPSFTGEWRWSRNGHHNERDRSEIVEIRSSRARQFWDVTVADEPHLFALASGVLTHNSKPNPMPESVRDRCTKAHEYVFLLTKSARYYFDAGAISEPRASDGQCPVAGHARGANEHSAIAHSRDKGDRKVFRGQGKYVNNDSFSPYGKANAQRGNREAAKDRRNRRSVWTIATAPFSEAHFATFPPELIEPCILAGSPKGGLVLDPFGGAGTTGLVADRLQRNAVLIELNPEYAAMARRRLSADKGPLLEMLDADDQASSEVHC